MVKFIQIRSQRTCAKVKGISASLESLAESYHCLVYFLFTGILNSLFSEGLTCINIHVIESSW